MNGVTKLDHVPYDAEFNPKVKEAIETIMSELNGGNRKQITTTIANCLRYEHRTLQQSFWSVLLLAQIAYSEIAHDGRNEQAVEFAGKVKQLAIDNNVDMGFIYL